jgi:hypothetical protein
MPFGLTNAPASFQSLMNKLFGGEKNIVVYLDDIIIYSNTWYDHLTHLHTAFGILQSAGLSAKAGTCCFGFSEMDVFGFLVGNGNIKPNPKKVEAIKLIPPPKDVPEIRTFLGIVNYYRQFIPNMATICIPLYNLTRKDVLWYWSDGCQKAFDELKQILSSNTVLRSADYTLPFILQCDASQVKKGISAILSQVDKNGEERPVMYLSRKLTKAECNYTITELECLAVIWGCEECHVYLIGAPFIIQTDHSALQWLKKTTFKSSS